jgi:ABC-type antimicrobial peptide transport system permease subunit
MYQFLTSRQFVIEGREPPAPGREPLAFVNGVTPTFIDTLGMKLAAGRNFSELDGLGAPPVAMINQSMADALFPGEDPVGRRLSRPETESADSIEIVGVFSDVDFAGNPSPQTTPFQVFVPLAQECWNYVTVSVRSSQPAAMVEPMRQTLKAIDSSVPVQMLSTADDLAAMPMRVMQLFTTILGAFGVLGLFLAALGLYGVIAYLLVQRTREIGVRLALGAQLRHMLWLVLGSGLRLAVIGTAIGFGLSVLVAFVLRAVFGTGTEQLELGGVLAATALVLAVALLASYLPARRAMKVSPLEALRTD